MSTLSDALAITAREVETVLNRLLPRPEGIESDLHAAMRHAVLNGGKRLRAFMVVQSSALFSVSRKCALRVAAAVECLHGYSLIHDDLPSMDDADLRRGQPACHVAFGEAAALLAGDALQTLAFEILAQEPTHTNPVVRCELVRSLARAVGQAGMVGGQMIDLKSAEHALDIGGLSRMQRLKTGALIAFSCEVGAVLGRGPAHMRHALQAYAHDLGLAFQIADDLLDVEGTEAETGKPVHHDSEAGKVNFVTLLGVENARGHARILADQAVGHLEPFDEKADLLRDLSRFVVERRK